MGACLDLRFWMLVAVVAGVLRALGGQRTIVFGCWNFLGLTLLGGWQLAASAALTSLVFWGLLRGAQSSSRGTRLAWITLAVPLGLFLIHKIGADWSLVRGWLSEHPQALLLHRLLVQLAFSYVFLRMVEITHCVVWKGMRCGDPLSTAGYLFPFHMLLAGPVSRYEDYLRLNEPQPPTDAWNVALGGANHVLTGLIYKYVVAEYLRVSCFGSEGRLASLDWLDTALLFIYLFFDFAGYSRIVLGAGVWMGVPTPENFRSPFAAASITDFFSRWHMSLGTFIQRNLYMPLQMTLVRRWGIRRALWAGLAALIPAWAFVGLWHRFSWAFLVYGLTFAGVVAVEKIARDRLLRQNWWQSRTITWTTRLLGPVYVFVVVTTMLHLVIAELMPT